MEYKDHENITLTIEGQLETYAKCKNATERHKCLWHAWHHNKQWLVQLLEWAMPSFPSYSKHDVSHAEALVHNIEMLMGESHIKQLSASDCFLLLHVIYVHDIGMCINAEYRKNLMQDPQFIEFLKTYQRDPKLKEYADILLTKCDELAIKTGKGNIVDDVKILQMKLKVFYAITYMTAEYRRVSHGDEAKKTLEAMLSDENTLGSGFSTSGIPSRFFEVIGTCAATHTSYDFEDIMKLSRTDGGYASDYMHPRFAAVMLQLGDALDLDNNRFHPLMKEFNDNLTDASKFHYEKHKSIRRLCISPSKISIHANCEEPEALRLVQQEYAGIKNIMQNATFNWSAICPEKLEMKLPELEPLVLLLKNKRINSELVNAKFEIQQTKAFNLLQGSNIYKNEKYVFLREIFQNAVDASKRQYWNDWQSSRWRRMGQKKCELFMDPRKYPIEVEFYLAVKDKYSKEYLILDTLENYNKYDNEKRDLARERIYGVVIKVRDYGTGISQSDVFLSGR